MALWLTVVLVLLFLTYDLAAAAKKLSPLNHGGGVHILDVAYHPLPQKELYTASCRYYTHDGKRKSDAAAKRSLDWHYYSESRRTWKTSTHTYRASQSSSDLQMRFDHAWEVFVGWVDNGKSDSEFLVEIGVGTPAQSFLASIDTGSPLTWLYSEDCCFQSNHSFFKPVDSSSYSIRKLDENGQPIAVAPDEYGPVDEGAQRWEIEYGSKNSSSIFLSLAYDTMTFFPREADDSLEVPEQTLGLVKRIRGATRGQGRDLRRNEALLGLSPGNGSKIPGKVQTPIEQLVKGDRIAQPLFTVTFVKALEPFTQSYGGRLIIGGFDEERTIGDVTWVPSTSTVFWGFDFEEGAMKYDGKDIWNSKNKRRAILDTGSSAIFLPKTAAQAINEQIQGSIFDKAGSRWLLPCKTGESSYEGILPIENQTKLFTIEIGGRHFGLPLRDIVLYPLIPVSKISAGNRDGYCNSAIQSGSEDFAVLGDPFIKNHAITFDYGGPELKNRRIGIANRRDTGIIVDAKGLIRAIGSAIKPIEELPDHLS